MSLSSYPKNEYYVEKITGIMKQIQRVTMPQPRLPTRSGLMLGTTWDHALLAALEKHIAEVRQYPVTVCGEAE